MSKVIVSEFVTLDGVMETPEKWQPQFYCEELGKDIIDGLSAAGALLLGRVTYQIFAGYWPFSTDEAEADLADRMNSLPKYVASTTLKEVEWNNSHLITGNIVEEVSRLKRDPDQDMLVIGSAGLVHTLMQHNLIDEYRLMVYPIVLGSGKRLFGDGSGTAALRLVSAKTYSSGVLGLSYQPAGKSVEG